MMFKVAVVLLKPNVVDRKSCSLYNDNTVEKVLLSFFSYEYLVLAFLLLSSIDLKEYVQ